MLTYTAEHTAAHTSVVIYWNTLANLGQALIAIIVVLDFLSQLICALRASHAGYLLLLLVLLGRGLCLHCLFPQGELGLANLGQGILLRLLGSHDLAKCLKLNRTNTQLGITKTARHTISIP
jgi:hypothetical protein